MKKLVNFRAVVFLAISQCFGICGAYGIVLGKTLLGIAVISLFVLGVCYFIFLYPFKVKIKFRLLISILFIFAFLIGYVGFSVKVNSFKNADLYAHYYDVTGKVVKANETDYGFYTIVDNVNLKGVNGGESKYKISLLIYGETDIDVGDEISFYTVLFDNDIYYGDNFSADNIEKNIKYTANVDATEIEITGKNLNVFERVNLFIRDSLKAGLDEDEFSVAYAMLTGDSSFIDDFALTNYRSAGVAHIFAVSGLHIGFLAVALGTLLGKLKVNDTAKTVVVFLVCLFYSGVCGFSASSIRATVMCAVLYFSKSAGEKYDGLTSVAFAGFTVLAYSPVQLFCVGFELSFTVVLGIILLSGPFGKLFKFLPQKLATSLGTVVAAQIVGIPISIRVFGTFSYISVLANLIFIPVVGFIYTLLLACTVIGGILSLEKFLLLPSNYILKFVNMLITAFDYKVFIISGVMVGIFALFYYFSLIVASGLINFNVITKRIVCAISVAVCITGITSLSLVEYFTPKIYVCGSEGVSATLIADAKEKVLVVEDYNGWYSFGKLKRFAENVGITEVDSVILLDMDVDIHNLATKILSVFKTSEIIYYGERHEAEEKVMAKSFPEVDCVAVNGDFVLSKEFNLRYSLEGNCVEGEKKGEKFAFIGEVKKGYSVFHGLNGSYSLITAYNGMEGISAEYNPETLVSYRRSEVYDDGETKGYFTYKFN